MAYIGLKHDSGSSGTDIAALLAKALGGGSDPSDEIKYQLMMSTLRNDALGRQLTREQITKATYEAIAQAKKNQYDQAAFNRNTTAGEARGAILEASAGQQAAAAAEAPVVVDASHVPVSYPRPGPVVPSASAASPFISSFPARPDYVPRSEPDFNYPVSAFPLHSDEPPVPVEPAMPPLPPQLTGLPPELYRKQEQPPMPPALTGLPKELGPLPALPPLPPALAGLPKELTPTGFAAGQPYETATPDKFITLGDTLKKLNSLQMPGEQALNDWGRSLFGGQAAAEAPVAVDQSTPGAIVNPLDTASATPPGPPLPASYFPPPATLDLPATPPPQQGPPIAAGANYASTPLSPLDIRPQDLPVEVQPPDTSALTGVPPELRANESIAVPGRNVAQPEPPVSLEAINPVATTQTPTSVPTGPPLAPPPPSDPNAGKITAGTGDALPAGAPTPPAQIMPGETVDHGDGTVSVNVGRGPTRLTHEQYQALGLQDAFNADAAGQTTKDAGTIKTIYDQGTGFTPAQQAEILSGGQPIGTKEEIVMKNATSGPADLTKNIVEVDKRKYEVVKGSDGKLHTQLIEGQPTASAGGSGTLGTGDAATQLDFAINLLTDKPDPKTWDRGQKLRYSTVMNQNFKADVKVTDAGKIVYVGGTIPAGWLPVDAVYPDGTAVKLDSNGAPVPQPGAAGAAAPPAQAAAAAPAPADAGGPAPATSAPAQPAKPAGGVPKQDAKGRYLDPATGAPNLGGYLVENQPGSKPSSRTLHGTEIAEMKSDEGPDRPTDQGVAKAFRLTSQGLRASKYFLDMDMETAKKVTPGVAARVLAASTDGTVLETIANGGGIPGMPDVRLSENDREYFRNLWEVVKDVSHQDSGADVTKSDLITYRKLFDLPGNPQPKDLIDVQNRIRDNLATSRTSFTGTIPSDWLRALDRQLHAFGIDPYDTGTQSRPAPAPATDSGQGYDYEEKP